MSLWKSYYHRGKEEQESRNEHEFMRKCLCEQKLKSLSAKWMWLVTIVNYQFLGSCAFMAFFSKIRITKNISANALPASCITIDIWNKGNIHYLQWKLSEFCTEKCALKTERISGSLRFFLLNVSWTTINSEINQQSPLVPEKDLVRKNGICLQNEGHLTPHKVQDN